MAIITNFRHFLQSRRQWLNLYFIASIAIDVTMANLKSVSLPLTVNVPRTPLPSQLRSVYMKTICVSENTKITRHSFALFGKFGLSKI
jgi:hypothetical protein